MTFVLHCNVLSCRLWHWTLFIPVTSKVLLLHVVFDLASLSIALIFIFLSLIGLEAAIRVLLAWSLSICSHLVCGFRAGSLVLCLAILIEYQYWISLILREWECKIYFFDPPCARVEKIRTHVVKIRTAVAIAIPCSTMCTRRKNKDARSKNKDRRCHCHSLLHHVHA